MEEYMRLKHLFDSLCCEMKLQSWTVHENQKGVVCTVRFVDPIDPLDSNRAVEGPHTEKWKKASAYSVKRDKDRMTKYNLTKTQLPRKSKRLENLQAENKRCTSSVSDDETLIDSAPVSPVSVSSDHSNNSSSQFQMDDHSPEACKATQESPTCDGLLDSPDHVTMPPIPTTPPNSVECSPTPELHKCELSETESCVSKNPSTETEYCSSSIATPQSESDTSDSDNDSSSIIDSAFMDKIAHMMSKRISDSLGSRLDSINSKLQSTSFTSSNRIRRQPFGPGYYKLDPSTSWLKRKQSSTKLWLQPPD